MALGERFARIWNLQRKFVHRPHHSKQWTGVQYQRAVSTSSSSLRPILPLTSLQSVTIRQSWDDGTAGGIVSNSKLNTFRTLYSGPVASWSLSVAPGALLQNLDCLVAIQRRHKKKFKRGQKKTSQEDFDSDDDKDEGEEEEYEEDYSLPLNYKQLQVNAKSTRVDNMLSSGLNISRNQIDQYFYSGKLRLNNEKLLKKGKAMEEGDYADIIATDGASDDDNVKVKRVKILKISENKTESDNYTIVIRAWRSAFTPELPKDL